MNIFGYFFGGSPKPTTEEQIKIDDTTTLSSGETVSRGSDREGRVFTQIPTQTPVATKETSPGFFGGMMKMALNAGGAVGNAAWKVGAYAGNKMKDGVHGVTKWALFSKEGQDEFKANLEAISGNSRLSQVIDAIVPRLTTKAFQVLDNHPYYSYLKPLYDGEDDFVQNLLRTVLLKIASNAANDIVSKERARSGLLDSDEIQIPNLTVAVLSDLAETVKTEFEKIKVNHANYENIMAMEDEDARQVALRALFQPAADALLQIGFPGGAADLKINSYIQDWVFNSIRSSLSDYMHVIYQQTVVPSHHEEKDMEVFSKSGGEALKALVKLMADKGTDAARSMIKEKKEFLVGFLDPVLTGGETKLVKEYLASELEQLAESKDPSINWLFKMLNNNLTSFSVRILSRLAETSPDKEETNVTAKALKNLLSLAVEFFGEDGQAFDSELEKIGKLTNELEISRAKARLFAPFIEKFLERTGLTDNPLVENFSESLPFLVETLYVEAKKIYPDQPKQKAALERALINHEAIEALKKEEANKERTSLSQSLIGEGIATLDDTVEMPEDLVPATFASTKASAKKGGTQEAQSPKTVKPTVQEPIIGNDLIETLVEVDGATQALEQGCGELSKDIKEIVLDYIANNKESVASAFAASLGSTAGDKAGLELADALAKVLGAKDKTTEKALEFAEGTLKTALFKIFVLVAENAKEQAIGEGHKDPVAAGLHKMVSLITKKIPKLEPDVKNIMGSKILTKEEKEKAIAALFAPVAEELLAIGGVDVDGRLKIQDALPIPQALRPFAMNAISQTLLPQLMSRVYLDLISAQYAQPKNEEKLAALVPSAPGSIGTIADYIARYVPFYLKSNADAITQMMLAKGEKYLNFLNPKAQKMAKSLIGRHITDASTNPDMDPVWKGISAFAQGFLTKAFLGAAENINIAEAHGKTEQTNPLLINLLMGVMQSGELHFKRISELQKETGTDKAHTLSHEQILADFSANGELHPALMKDMDPNATAEEKANMRLEHFFKPLAKNLIALSGLDKSRDFPIPEAFKDSGWEIFQDKILPEVLMGLYNEALKPQNIVQIMSNVVDKLNLASESFEEESTSLAGAPFPVDATQAKLNEQIGNLIKSFVDMLPTSASQTLFSIRKIKDMSAETLGEIVRRKTNATSLLEVVNGLLQGVTLTPPDVNDTRTPEEIAKDDMLASKALQSKLTTFISNQAKKTARNWISSKWDSFQKNFDDTVEKYLGAPGKAVKVFLDWAFGGIMRFILPVLDYIVFRMIWSLVDLHIWNKAGEIISNSKLSIHENLAFNITGKAVDSIHRQLIEAKKEEERKKALQEKARIDDEQLAEYVKKKLIHQAAVGG